MYEVAIEILKKINELGYESYIVGGYPRDKYLGIDNLDIDMCTNASYEDLKEHFIITKGNFGSMRLNYKDFEFEITTFRKEYEYDKNRYPKKIEFVHTKDDDSFLWEALLFI
jgi:tRNA nucleotidyltransferase/poly(A) polymerase